MERDADGKVTGGKIQPAKFECWHRYSELVHGRINSFVLPYVPGCAVPLRCQCVSVLLRC